MGETHEVERKCRLPWDKSGLACSSPWKYRLCRLSCIFWRGGRWRRHRRPTPCWAATIRQKCTFLYTTWNKKRKLRFGPSKHVPQNLHHQIQPRISFPLLTQGKFYGSLIKRSCKFLSEKGLIVTKSLPLFHSSMRRREYRFPPELRPPRSVLSRYCRQTNGPEKGSRYIYGLDEDWFKSES